MAAYGRYYGSIAVSIADNAVGWSWDYRTKRKAKKRALRECKNNSDTPSSCKTVGWVRNGCLALAVRENADGSVARTGAALARKKASANRKALKKCGPNCKRRAVTCTKR